MKRNMGTADRVLRVILALFFAFLILSGEVEGWAAIILGILGAAFVFTGAIGSCSLYTPLGIDTRGKKA
ncbi:MAG: DUF2892 domain-containing protein [Bacteroidota bacterium]